MALTVGTKYAFDLAKSSPQQKKLGAKVEFVPVTFDASYATGGLALTVDTLGFDEVLAVYSHPVSGYVFEYDAANAKLKALFADYDAGADGVLIESTASADLSAITVNLMVVGI